MTVFQRMVATFFLGLTLTMTSALPMVAYGVPPVPFNLGNGDSFGAANIKPAGTGTVGSFEELAGKVINFILSLLGIIAVILVLISGFQWMTAESEDKVKEARKRLFNSIIGLAIVALSWVIAYAIIGSIAKITQ